MPLDGSDTNTSNENEFSVTETQMNALLDSGDLMLANHWEEHDFVTRLEVELTTMMTTLIIILWTKPARMQQFLPISHRATLFI